MNNTIYIFDYRKFGKKNLTYIIQLIEGSGKTVLAHNAKFDWKYIYKYTGVKLMNMYDTMLAEVMLNMGIGDRFYSLKALVVKYLDIELDKETRNEFIDNPDIILTESVLAYSALDVMYLEEIYNQQRTKMWKQGLTNACDLIEMPVISATAEMEFYGIKLIAEKWEELEKTAKANAEKQAIVVFDRLLDDIMSNLKYKDANDICILLEIKKHHTTEKQLTTKIAVSVMTQITDKESIKTFLRGAINLNSTYQLLNVLNKVYKVRDERKKPLKSTNEKIINKYAKKYPIIEELIQYREYVKGASSFGQTYIQEIHPTTGRIHTEFNQLGAATSRYSSEKPDMQNVLKADEYRSGFVAEDGWKFICADFSQQEVRAIADISKDKAFAKMFREKLDPHTFTASGLFDIPYDQIRKDSKERSKAKNVNFGISYGISSWGLYKQFDIPEKEGQVLLDKYWKIYIGYKAFKDAVENIIWEKRYSQTLTGRKRYFTVPISWTGNASQEEEKYKAKKLREGVNLIIQGTCAEITKLSLIKIQRESPYGENLRCILQVHDEVIIEVHDSIAVEARDFVERMMLEAEGYFIKTIECAVDCKLSDHWVH
jgi:DNA polymerase I-like protein with 3'-5' exonuclease and polymerase domains